MLNLLPSDVVRCCIMHRLPASEIVRSRLIARNWNEAYLDGSVPNSDQTLFKTQPRTGGRCSVGFILETDDLQQRAGAELQSQKFRHFGIMEDAFPAFAPRIIATSHGFHLVRLMELAVFRIWNPVVNQFRRLPDPDIIGLGLGLVPCQFGLHVHGQEGAKTCEYYVCVVLYLPPHLNHPGANHQTVGIKICRNTDRVWTDMDFELPLVDEPVPAGNAFRPAGVVCVAGTIYFHVSRIRIVLYFSDIAGTGHAFSITLPEELHDANPVLVAWKNSAAVMHMHQVTSIRIHPLNWLGELSAPVEISLIPAVERCRPAFFSLGHNLRGRFVSAELPLATLAGARLVGYAGPGWFLLYQRNGHVRIQMISQEDEIFESVRVDLGPYRPHMPFFTCDSSFLQFKPVPEVAAAAGAAAGGV